ncbi:hypothetical protein [Pseudofrankia sp. BMG5.36]|uniref:hypothetical protein n=1 Tax=Pseudofrankia sp. BMG5.36 TaxID=1834512 RepID=UPI0008D95B78|nr:hypothetical protein [Pseudofrankia sp. BMG5.36]OHV43386.1 hypothetical protein BCD48_28885 [Pseudofrankia sp. BMG5.36]
MRLELASADGLDLVGIVAGRGADTVVVTREETAFLAAELARRHDADGLWRLALDLPLARAVEAVRAVPARWAPRDVDERRLHRWFVRTQPAAVQGVRAQACRRLAWPDAGFEAVAFSGDESRVSGRTRLTNRLGPTLLPWYRTIASFATADGRPAGSVELGPDTTTFLPEVVKGDQFGVIGRFKQYLDLGGAFMWVGFHHERIEEWSGIRDVVGPEWRLTRHDTTERVLQTSPTQTHRWEPRLAYYADGFVLGLDRTLSVRDASGAETRLLRLGELLAELGHADPLLEVLATEPAAGRLALSVIADGARYLVVLGPDLRPIAQAAVDDEYVRLFFCGPDRLMAVVIGPSRITSWNVAAGLTLEAAVDGYATAASPQLRSGVVFLENEPDLLDARTLTPVAGLAALRRGGTPHVSPAGGYAAFLDHSSNPINLFDLRLSEVAEVLDRPLGASTAADLAHARAVDTTVLTKSHADVIELLCALLEARHEDGATSDD